MLTTTIKEVYSHRPCNSGFAKLLNSLFAVDIDPGSNIAEMKQRLTGAQFHSPVTLLQILDSNGFDDALWALRCWDFREYGEMVVQWAESVEHFASGYPAVAECNRATRRWLKGEITDEELVSAAESARSAAESARSAARSAAESAARSARSARSAARSAAESAAESAARSAPWSAAWSAQTAKNEEIMRRFLT